MAKIVGIDPGLSGAMGFLDGWTYKTFDLPVTTGLDKQNVIDSHLVFDMLNDLRPEIIMFELQQVQMITGKKTAFIMGRTYQSLLMGIEMYQNTFEVSVVSVRPQEWKKSLGLIAPKGSSSKAKKQITADFVKNVFPRAEIYTPRGRLLDGRSDALAIAEHARRKYC